MKRWWWLVALVVIPRLAAFPFSENLQGDAIARTWLAHVWLAHPHIIGSFDQGAMQFGPLHIYLLALAEWVWPSLLHAGRVVSLVVGCASAWPLFALTRRLFGTEAAVAAVVGFGFWGFHLQASTTSASEALSLFLVLAAVERFSAWQEAPQRSVNGLWAALVLNLACATRYDAWLLVPLLALVAGWTRRSLWTLVWFGAASSAFALAWSVGNFLDRGDPLYPFRYIDDFHRAWYPNEAALWGPTRFRLISLLFWPGAAVLSLSPWFGVASGVGLVRTWRQGRHRWLVLVIVLPAAAYTFRSVVLGSFVPLARFTVKELVLGLVFAGPVLANWRRQVLVLTTGAWCGAVLALSLSGTSLGVSLSPLSPVSRIDDATRQVATWLTTHCELTQTLVVDEDPRGYDDLVLSYYSGVQYEHQARLRSPRFRQRLLAAPVDCVLLFEGGRLEREGAAHSSAETLEWQGLSFERAPGFPSRLRLGAMRLKR